MKEDDVCQVECVHETKVKQVLNGLDPEFISGMAKIFKALADDTRLKIAYSLYLEGELCVCDVASIAGSTTATASHHLRFLRRNGLAKYRKEGKLVYYSLSDDHVKQLIVMAFEHQKELNDND
ncbi:ArsR/SmtB family transcription factor [Mesobacillus zeae]|uniref:ArsR family transcriptional regulator n=1 Tax=Mesobacillus zeae TaxID=1917180 RepID=A0A398BA38_9BACI|nr:metalloregulator ArsR/SmtB family transcription factor [Mesobacillus zeae]RID85708.1 ArsR family transcriptional regulator [Mesobacillus zeae]